MLASCNNSKQHPALRYYCPNVSQFVCKWRKHVTRCFQSDWLVSVDGVNECISIMVQNSEKNEYFPYLLAFLLGSMSAVSPNLCLLWLEFGNSLAQGNEELWRF